MPATITNPIIPGFSPDPSICHVDGTFFLVTSSFQFFPGLPIYASRDLQHWTHISNAVNRNAQLSLAKVSTFIQTYNRGDVPDDELSFIYTWGVAAATLRHHCGCFYLVATLVNPIDSPQSSKEYLNFLMRCDNIYDDAAWSDPVFFEFQGIDPDIFFEDDTLYVTGSYTFEPKVPGKPRTTIRQFTLDPTTGAKMSPETEVWPGWEGCQVVPEGPHIYKKYDAKAGKSYYYLLVSDGGTFAHHMLTVARSERIGGPYVLYEGNPVLTADPSGQYTAPVYLDEVSKTIEEVQYTGHGDLFCIGKGEGWEEQWWCVVLGTRYLNGKHPMGRETFLVKADWSGEWPRFPQRVKLQLERPPIGNDPYLQDKHPVGQLIPDAVSERLEFLHIKNPIVENYKLVEIGSGSSKISEIWIRPGTFDLDSEETGISFIGKRQRRHEETVRVSLDLGTVLVSRSATDRKHHHCPLKTGLSLFKDKFRVFEIGVKVSAGDPKLKVYFSAKSPNSNQYTEKDLIDLHSQSQRCSSLKLKISASMDRYEFSYAFSDDSEWHEIGQITTRDATAWDFTGTLFGIFAILQDGFLGDKYIKFGDLEVGPS